MRALILAVVATIGVVAAAKPDVEIVGPNTGHILQLSNSSGLGAACPVSAEEAFTAKHVIADGEAFPDRSDAFGNFGQAELVGAMVSRDIALLHGSFPAFYEIASEAPAEGEALWIVGYEWHDHATAMRRKIVLVHYSHRVGAMLVYDSDAEPGSSGSCVLNAAGQVVGVNVWGMEIGTGVGLAVSVIGEVL